MILLVQYTFLWADPPNVKLCHVWASFLKNENQGAIPNKVSELTSKYSIKGSPNMVTEEVCN